MELLLNKILNNKVIIDGIRHHKSSFTLSIQIV